MLLDSMNQMMTYQLLSKTRLKRRRKIERSPTNQSRQLALRSWNKEVSNSFPTSHKLLKEEEEVVVKHPEVEAEAEVVVTVEEIEEVEEEEEVAEEAEVVIDQEREEPTLMETQSNLPTDQEEMVQLRAEEVTEKINLAEVEEEEERTVTEEVALEPTKLLFISKRAKTSLKKKRPLRLLNQNQLLRWKPSVYQLTISLQAKPRPQERKPELLKVSRVPKLKLLQVKRFIKLQSSRRDSLLTTLRLLMLQSTPCSDSKPEVTMMYHQEVAEEETEVEEEEEPRVAVAEDKMPSKPLELPTTISQLCEHEDLLDLDQKCCLIHQCSINGV
jgi:hypothetical protein